MWQRSTACHSGCIRGQSLCYSALPAAQASLGLHRVSSLLLADQGWATSCPAPFAGRDFTQSPKLGASGHQLSFLLLPSLCCACLLWVCHASGHMLNCQLQGHTGDC